MSETTSTDLERGRVLLEHKRWAEAAEAFRRHVSAWPRDDIALSMMAVAFAFAGPATHVAAVAASDEAMRLAANRPYNLYARALVAANTDVPVPAALSASLPRDVAKRRLHISRHFATMAIQSDPDFIAAHTLPSRIAWCLNEPVGMRSAAEQVLRRQPQDVDALGLRARSFEIEGRTAEALAAAEQGLFVSADDALLQSVRAWALLQSGRDADAEQSFRDSLRLDPTSQINQLGLRDAQHNQRLQSTSAARKFFLSEKERRPASNRVQLKVGGSIGAVVAIVAVAGQVSRLIQQPTAAARPPVARDLVSQFGVWPVAISVVAVVAFAIWLHRRTNRKS